MKLFFVLALFAFALSLQAKTCLVVEPFIPDDSLVRAAEACAGDAGYSVTTADIGSLAEKGCASYDLTVFCDGAWLPQEFTTPFWHYLNNGKKAVFLGAPAWEHPLVKVNGKWTERDKYMKKAVKTLFRKACEGLEKRILFRNFAAEFRLIGYGREHVRFCGSHRGQNAEYHPGDWRGWRRM